MGSPMPRTPRRAPARRRTSSTPDDASGVRSDGGHVGEPHAVRILAEFGTEEIDLLVAHHGQHLLAGIEALLHERECSREEFLARGMDERLVGEGLLGSCGRGASEATPASISCIMWLLLPCARRKDPGLLAGISCPAPPPNTCKYRCPAAS